MNMLQQVKLMFDLNGFVHLRNVFTPQEIKSANDAINVHQKFAIERGQSQLRNTKEDSALSGDGTTGRVDLGGMLLWDAPHCNFFRQILADERLIPIFHTLLGEGYRMDHQPMVITSKRGAEGFTLHGGPVTAKGRMNHYLQYRCVQGDIHNSLLAVAIQLSDHNEGSGGFCVVPGTHKMNFPLPDDIKNGTRETNTNGSMHVGGMNSAADFFTTNVKQPITKAGDVIVFSEATVHGSLPWNEDFERRVALYRFSPANHAYGRGYLSEQLVKEYTLGGFTDAQLAVLQPPYNVRLERSILNESANAVVGKRDEWKKKHDNAIFGTDYF